MIIRLLLEDLANPSNAVMAWSLRLHSRRRKILGFEWHLSCLAVTRSNDSDLDADLNQNM